MEQRGCTHRARVDRFVGVNTAVPPEQVEIVGYHRHALYPLLLNETRAQEPLRGPVVQNDLVDEVEKIVPPDPARTRNDQEVTPLAVSRDLHRNERGDGVES
ncbi:hypothetical protein YH62_27185 [Rhizobium sp. LC145]|nr:hypothetical protein YH62_27185 [Rhizobium sp. LC145]